MKPSQIKQGTKIGRWTVTGETVYRSIGKNLVKKRYALCRCDCGQEREVSLELLANGESRSCGCLMREKVSAASKARDYSDAAYKQIVSGQRFGSLTTLGPAVFKESTPGARIYHVPCVCDCGQPVSVYVHSLLRGVTHSCGCLQKSVTAARSTKHGQAMRGKQSRLYQAWCKMRARCEDPKNNRFFHYGARGIYVCDEWQNFPAFQEWATNNGYAPHLTIDRIDNDLPYHPSNCRWATDTEQANNKSSNVFIEAWGEEKTVAQWSRDDRCQVSYATLLSRLQVSFWEPERAISTPAM